MPRSAGSCDRHGRRRRLVQPRERGEHPLAVGRRPEGGQRALEEPGIPGRHHPRVEEGHDAAVVGPADQPAGALREPQRGVGGRHGHEPVAAHPGDGLRPRRRQRVVGPRERDAVDDHELAGRAGHVDALPQGEGAEQAGVRVAGELPHQRGDLVLALAQEPDVVTSKRSRIASVGVLRPRASRRTGRACGRRRPGPAPRSRRGSASLSPSRPGGGRCCGDVGDRLLAGSRTGCRRRGPCQSGRPRRAGPWCRRRRRSVPPSSSVAEVSTTVRSPNTLSRNSIGDAHRRDAQDRARGAGRGSATRRRARAPRGCAAEFSNTSSTAARATLRAPSASTPCLGLELGLHLPGGVAHPRERERTASPGCRSSLPSGERVEDALREASAGVRRPPRSTRRSRPARLAAAVTMRAR